MQYELTSVKGLDTPFRSKFHPGCEREGRLGQLMIGATLAPLNTQGCASPSFSCPIEPTVSSPSDFFYGAFRCQSYNNERAIRPKCKQHENTTALNKQKRTICLVKCWRHRQLACFEALLTFEKSTIQRHRGARSFFLRLAVQNRYPSKVSNFLFPIFIVSHRTNTSGKRICVVTERCIFWDQHWAATHIPTARLVWSNKKMTCKSRVGANDSPCMGREGNRFESFGHCPDAHPQCYNSKTPTCDFVCLFL